MLKEGWDVRNVTAIVGLRAYAAQEQHPARADAWAAACAGCISAATSARPCPCMGTPAFMDFVESIQSEGVTFERVADGRCGGRERQDSLVVEVEPRTPDKDIDALDIALPRLTRRFNREFKDLAELDPASFGNPKLPLKPFTPEETREIVFKTMLDAEVDHTIQLDGSGPGGLPLRRRLLRPPVAEGPAPGRRLRRALPEGQDIHPRSPVRGIQSISKTR